MATSPDSNRRDFIVGRAARRELLRAGEALADELIESTPRPAPIGGETARLETRAMACQWAVILNPGDPRSVMCASDALRCVYQAEQLLTVFRDDSDVARLNANAAQGPQPVASELVRLLLACRGYWEQTAGACDIAAGVLIALWRAARAAGRLPGQDEVNQALADSGMHHVRIDATAETVAFDRGGLQLDFGAVGKGYGIDRAAAHLEHEEVEDFLIHGGHSSLFARGGHHGHAGWPVGLKNPVFPEQRYATVLLRNQGLATSGSNLQFYRSDGRRLGHILDPRSGWPAAGLLSVTVLAPTALEADALSTALYVMGLDKAVRYCEDHQDLGAILIPAPTTSRNLTPVICNIDPDQLFLESLATDVAR